LASAALARARDAISRVVAPLVGVHAHHRRLSLSLSVSFCCGGDSAGVLGLFLPRGAWRGRVQLIHFFTSGTDEVKAWTIKQGRLAPQAAGCIHTDFEKARALIGERRRFIAWERVRPTGARHRAGRATARRGREASAARRG
jgi:hypothetical protein